MQINLSLSFPSRLRNAEHFDLYSTIKIRLIAKITKPLGVVTAWNNFILYFNKEDELYKRSMKQESTTYVLGLHDKRRISYQSVKRLFEFSIYSEDAQIKAAAEVIMGVLDNYAMIGYVPMNEASAIITNLIQDLKKEKYAASIALISGASAEIDRLERDNDTFIIAYSDRSIAEEEKKNEGRLIEARAATDSKFAILVNVINAFYLANEMSSPKDQEISDILSEVILIINSNLHKYEEIYARRNPAFRSSGSDNNKPSIPDSEIPGTDVPGDTTPVLTIASQSIVGTRMLLQASDTAAFASILSPAAENGSVYIQSPETNNFDAFPIISFKMDTDNVTPIGLLVDPPATNETFDKPFGNFGFVSESYVAKEGVTLAKLQNVLYPYMTRED
jgi:hypothetical protein